MYSHELADYIKRHNYRLNAHQLEFIMDTREHPQISRISYNDQYQSYDIYTKDNFHLSFGAVPYMEYCEQMKGIINNDKINSNSYRLYIASHEEGYKLFINSQNVMDAFNLMDDMILNRECRHNKYLLIQNHDDTDDPIYLGYGNKIDYLKFKKSHLESFQKDTSKSLTL